MGHCMAHAHWPFSGAGLHLKPHIFVLVFNIIQDPLGAAASRKLLIFWIFNSHIHSQNPFDLMIICSNHEWNKVLDDCVGDEACWRQHVHHHPARLTRETYPRCASAGTQQLLSNIMIHSKHLAVVQLAVPAEKPSLLLLFLAPQRGYLSAPTASSGPETNVYISIMEMNSLQISPVISVSLSGNIQCKHRQDFLWLSEIITTHQETEFLHS